MKTKVEQQLEKINLYENGKIKLEKDQIRKLQEGKMTDPILLEKIKVKNGEADITAKIKLEKDQIILYPYWANKKLSQNLTAEENKYFQNDKINKKIIQTSGVVIDKGEQKYKGDENNEMSYFVKIEKEGEQKTIWDKNLKDLDIKIGDNIGIKNEKNNWFVAKDVELEDKTLLFQYDKKMKKFNTIDRDEIYKIYAINGKPLEKEDYDLLIKGKLNIEGKEYSINLNNNNLIENKEKENIVLVTKEKEEMKFFIIQEKNDIKNQNKENLARFYLDSLNKLKAYLTDKMETYPNNYQIQSDFNVVSRESSRISLVAMQQMSKEQQNEAYIKNIINLNVNDSDTYQDARRAKEEEEQKKESPRMKI